MVTNMTSPTVETSLQESDASEATIISASALLGAAYHEPNTANSNTQQSPWRSATPILVGTNPPSSSSSSTTAQHGTITASLPLPPRTPGTPRDRAKGVGTSPSGGADGQKTRLMAVRLVDKSPLWDL